MTILALQLVNGLLWLIPFVLFAPCIWRIWRGTGDALDVIGCPAAFIAANQIGFVVRWLLFHDAVSVMSREELTFWAGLYTLSALCALGLVLAWRIARRLR